jgi:hypothetical protein
MNNNNAATVWNLPNGYVLRLVDEEFLSPYLKEWMPKMFAGHSSVFPVYSESERTGINLLKTKMGRPLRLDFALFYGEEFVGWHIGDQLSATEFYMRNSAVLPEHRGRGLYSAMLVAVKEYVLQLGFQEITSKHNTTNNAVIVPKLKQGFVISSLEVSDVFGVLVVLKFLANERRRKLTEIRSGMSVPDGEILETMQRGRG